MLILLYIHIILYFVMVYFQNHISTCKCVLRRIKNLMCVHTCACLHACMNKLRRTTQISTCHSAILTRNIHKYLPTCRHTCMHACMLTYMCVCVHARVHAWARTCVYVCFWSRWQRDRQHICVFLIFFSGISFIVTIVNVKMDCSSVGTGHNLKTTSIHGMILWLSKLNFEMS